MKSHHKYINNIQQLEMDSRSLVLPESCQQTLTDFNMINGKVPLIKQSLIKWGICILALQYDDKNALTMQYVVKKIGKSHGHDNKKSIVWDIKSGGSDGKQSLARSHKMSEFVLHTDCSYEDNIPNFFGLQVIRHDKNNGGKNLLVDVGTLIQHLSSKTIRILQSKCVKINVPPEFRKDKSYTYERVIDKDLNIRYRKEIIDHKALDDEQRTALRELELVAYSPLMTRSFFLKKNTILLLDNKRYLHARTKILDSKRHLKRVRFFMNEQLNANIVN